MLSTPSVWFEMMALPFSDLLHYLKGLPSDMGKKHDKTRQKDDSKEGGGCHRLEINMVEHDRVKRGGLA